MRRAVVVLADFPTGKPTGEFIADLLELLSKHPTRNGAVFAITNADALARLEQQLYRTEPEEGI